MEHQDLVHDLEKLASQLIALVVDHVGGVREGTVMTVGPAPYRRLDADGRALAYVRVRPRKRAVRVDVSGLWKASSPSRLRSASAGGTATLLVRGPGDLREAARFLAESVAETRSDSVRRSEALPRAA